MILSKLYLGRNIDKTGLTVTDDWLDRFLRDQVSPLFPGFTVIHAEGYWNGEPEKTTILEILHEPGDAFKVATIADHYKYLFHQESVLVLTITPEGVGAQF